MDAELSILYHAAPGQSLLGIAQDGKIIELMVHRPSMVAGAVILGRVAGTAPGTGGLFIDIGQDRPGFLPQPPKSLGKMTQGQTVLVMVKADAVIGKGPSLSADIALAGRLLSYTPRRPGLAASKRLPDDEIERLSALLSPLLKPDEGVSLRPSANGADKDALAEDLNRLRARWHPVVQGQQGKAPAILSPADPLDRLLGLYPNATTIFVSSTRLLADVKPHWGALAQLDERECAQKLEAALDEALAETLPLPSGGKISIGQMAALTAIDVDSGAGKPEAANTEACAAIARAIRLRGLGGQMVVDFIPGNKTNLNKWGALLKRLTATDPTPTTILGATPMGLVELTRERRGPSIPELMLQMPYPQRTALSLGLDALEQAVKAQDQYPGKPLTLQLPPAVTQALKAEAAALLQARAQIPAGLTLADDANLARHHFHISPTS